MAASLRPESATVGTLSGPAINADVKKSTADRTSVTPASGNISISDASTHWESCNEVPTNVSHAKKTKTAAAAAPPIQHTDATASATGSELKSTKASTVRGDSERPRSEYTTSGPNILRNKQPTAPSESGRLSGTGVPREVRFSVASPAERSNVSTPRSSSRLAQEYTSASSRNVPTQDLLSHKYATFDIPKLDPATARQVRKGRLVVESTSKSPKPFCFW